MAVRYSTDITIGEARIEHPPSPFEVETKAAWLANAIFCPLGPAPMKGWFCLTKDNLDKLDLNSAQTIRWVYKESTEDSGTITTTRTLNFPGMYFIQSTRLLQGGVGDDNALHLAEFADARYLLDLNSDTGSTLANIRTQAKSDDFLTGTTANGTWENLTSALWLACGLLGSFPGLPADLTVDGVPNNAWLVGMNAWKALCILLDQLDCAVGRDPFSNTFTIYRLGEAQTIAPAASSLKWNAELRQSNVTSAATLKFYFPLHYKNFGQERDTELTSNWVVSGNNVTSTVATGISGAIGTLSIWDDLPGVISEVNQLSNAGELNTRATNRKNRYVSRNGVSPGHRIHYGLLTDFTPGGQIRAVLWRNWGDGTENELGGTVTEFITGKDLVTDFRGKQGEPTWFGNSTSIPEKENYLAPDLARHTFPSYPRVTNVVQLIGSGVQVGQQAQPVNGVHPGEVKRWVAGSMSSMHSCWLRFIDEHDTKNGNVPGVEGEYYGPGRLSGIFTHLGFTLPLYLVKKGGGSGTPIIEFQTSGDRTPSSASFQAALVSAFGATSPDNPQNFTVWDARFLFPRALSGGKGLAAFNENLNRWEVIVVQQQCLFARALINEQSGMAGQAGLVQITSFEAITFGIYSQEPDPNPTQALNFFLHRGRFNDDILLAWDEASDEWIIVDVQKKQLRVMYHPSLRINQDFTQLQGRFIDCAVEYSDDVESNDRWVDIMPLGRCAP